MNNKVLVIAALLLVCSCSDSDRLEGVRQLSESNLLISWLSEEASEVHGISGRIVFVYMHDICVSCPAVQALIHDGDSFSGLGTVVIVSRHYMSEVDKDNFTANVVDLPVINLDRSMRPVFEEVSKSFAVNGAFFVVDENKVVKCGLISD